MQGRRHLIAALCLGLLAPIAVAVPQPLDFELSDGQRFVRLSALPPAPTVLNFWHVDCAPCLRELPMLAKQADSARVRIVTIALHPLHREAALPAAVGRSLQTPLLTLRAPTEARGLLARFGNRRGALPYTVVLDAQRRACARHVGEIDAAWLAQALRLCMP